MSLNEQGIGSLFQQQTQYARSTVGRRHLAAAPSSISPEIRPLPRPRMEKGPDLWNVLLNRRSIRDYGEPPLLLAELADLLFAIQGTTAKSSFPWYRTAPSAGALHPIDTYLVVNRIDELEAGIYLLRIEDFSLEMKKKGDFSWQIARAALDQNFARTAAVVFIWVAVIHRSRQKYRERAYRYIYLDCGHICQNLYLAATALGIGCCGVGAFFDDEVNELVGVDGQEETAIYLATVGKKYSPSMGREVV